MPADERKSAYMRRTRAAPLTHANLDLLLAEVVLLRRLGAGNVTVLESNAHRTRALSDELGDMLNLIQARSLRSESSCHLVNDGGGRQPTASSQLPLRAGNGNVVAYDQEADRVLAEVSGRPALFGQSEVEHISCVVLDDNQSSV